MKAAGRLWAAALAGLAIAARGVFAHPLDGLSQKEIASVPEILKAEGRVTADARYPLIELKEPDKSAVLAWKAGDPEHRIATVVATTSDGTFEGEIDLDARKVSSWARASGQPMLLLEEFLGASALVRADPTFVAGLHRRGLEANQVFCLPLTAGAFGGADEAGRRLMKVPCYVNPGESNFYAKPIEGLFAVVDLVAKKVLQVVDTGVVPIPKDSWGYTEAEIEKRTGTLPPIGHSATLRQAGGPNFVIDGSAIQWDIWRFRLRVDKRPGVVLSEVEVNDGRDWRSVLYQMHLSEVFVPYMDPSEGWYWRTYMDSGEYGFGVFLSPLRENVDCPAHATFLSAFVPSDLGLPTEIPKALCIFERDVGDPAWRHYEVFAQTPENPVPAEGRPATELVVRSASEVGNYDYLIDYVFQPNGTIRIMVGSTGVDAVKGVSSTAMSDATAATDTRYGTLIAPNLVAPNHDHFFNFRLDFDIDGRNNTFMRTALVPSKVPGGLPRRSLWRAEDVMAMREAAGRYRVDPAKPAMFHLMNESKDSGLGHHPGYMIVPENSAAYSPLDVVRDPPAKRNGYIQYSLWNTAYAKGERYAGGAFAFQSDGSDGLPVWAARNRNIHDTDIVTWYTIGFHHVPHMEDWPVMSTGWKGIALMPFNFFQFNPAVRLRMPK